MQIGSYHVELLPLGRFRMDGGAFFGIIPRPLWTRFYPHADEDNRVELVAWSLLIRGEGRILVVDAGIGDKLEPKKERIFGLVQEPRPLEKALEERGLAPDDVTDFVYTHLHFDHAGGSTRWGTPLGRDGGGADSPAVPVFPKARHYLQRAQLQWARNPTDKDRASFLPENWEPVISAGLLHELDGEAEILPGIELRPLGGHTAAMQVIVIRPAGEEGGLLFAVDAVPTAAHLPLHYIPAFDNHPLLAMEEKRRLLEEAAEKRLVVCFGHDPFTPAALVRRAARKFELERKLELDEVNSETAM